jgi:hypothetical protein
MNDPIFIVGNSRSGTTLVSRILKNHPDIHILNETHFIHVFERYLKDPSLRSDAVIWKIVNLMLTIQRKNYYRKKKYEEYPEMAKAIMSDFQNSSQQDFVSLNRIFFEHEAMRHGKSWAGDQTPRHVFHIHEILEMYPNAKFIQMVRNPCAVLLSQKRKWKAALRWRLPKFEVLRTLLNYHPITTTLIWEKAISAGMNAQQAISTKRMKTIWFENLVENPHKIVEELCNFLQINYIPEMCNVSVEFSANAQDERVKGIRESISKRWEKELSKTEIYLAEKFSGYLISFLGYNFTEAKPNLLMLLFFLALWPLQLSVAFCLNLNRMGNPIRYFSNRIFLKPNVNIIETRTLKK